MADLKPLIAYIVDQVREQGGSPNKTTLVKLLYLIDVESCRKLGKPATGLEWKFHHYGPYSAQLERDINDNAFLHVFGDRNSGYGFHITSDWRDIHQAFDAGFGPGIKRVADSVVNQWGLQELQPILEYVYFETEPMQEARRGEALDFSTIQPEEAPPGRRPRLTFSDEFINNLRTRWDQRKRNQDTSNREWEAPGEPIYDEVYDEALRRMADEDGMTPASPRRHRLEGPDQGRSP